jgi:FkbM family methyltransferase
VSRECRYFYPCHRCSAINAYSKTRPPARRPPRRRSESPLCCRHAFSFRPGTTDFQVYTQIFVEHYMRYLYSIFESSPPRYVLDAGANAGFTTTLFKLLWPAAVVVSLEPDPANFAALVRQTAELEGVHAVNAGLWGRRARVALAEASAANGAWGHIFTEVPGSAEEAAEEAAAASEGGAAAAAAGARALRALRAKPAAKGAAKGLQAYSVADVAAMHGIPAFDFVKIDIEGAEGAVFDPATADLSWVDAARVISLEVHDYFAEHFGLKDVSTNIGAAMAGRPFTIVADNEHVFYLKRSVVEALGGAR